MRLFILKVISTAALRSYIWLKTKMPSNDCDSQSTIFQERFLFVKTGKQAVQNLQWNMQLKKEPECFLIPEAMQQYLVVSNVSEWVDLSRVVNT